VAKYWKTTVITTVLSEGFNPPDYSSLSEVAEDIDNGDASGEVTYDHTEVSKDTMRELLIAQGSDPEFLIIEDED
jgi:hypothetical protein